MKKELMKRVAAAGLAVSMVAGLTACGPTGKPEETKKEETKAEGGETSAAADKEDAAASDGEVTLRFSWWGGDARHKATEAACQAFMEKYPNIKVECEYGAWDGWAEKVATQLSGGTAPDLMQVNWNWLYQFSSDGSKFVDLTQFAGLGNKEMREGTFDYYMRETIVKNEAKGVAPLILAYIELMYQHQEAEV